MTTIHVLTWNILHPRYDDELVFENVDNSLHIYNRRLFHVRNSLQKWNMDIVALQEVDMVKVYENFGPWADTNGYHLVVSDNKHFRAKCQLRKNRKPFGVGNVLFLKKTLFDVLQVEGDFRHQLVTVQYIPTTRTITIGNVHLRATRKRDCLPTWKKYHVDRFEDHFVQYTRRQHKQEVSDLFLNLDILMGDFNESNLESNEDYKHYIHTLPDAKRNPTCNTMDRVDHILTRFESEYVWKGKQKFRPRDFYTKVIPSDHRPVFKKINLS